MEVRSAENEELIRKYEQSPQGVAQTTGSQNRLQGNVFQNVGNLRFQGFCSGICVMGGIILVSVLYMYIWGFFLLTNVLHILEN